MANIFINGNQKRLNWKRQPTDLRDVMLHHVEVTAKVLPTSGTTVRIASPAIRDQLSVGSCTQNAGAAAMAFVHMKQIAPLTAPHLAVDPLFSRLFGYWWTRHLEGTPADEDSGCNVRDVFKAYRKWGLCLEATWPYMPTKFALQPSAAASTEAVKHKAVKFIGLATLHALKQSIAGGDPFIFGFDCFESLESAHTAKTGLIPLPGPHEKSIGGHSMFADTYDDARQEISGNNSWGLDWGIGGRFRLPYDYWTTGLASDATSLRSET